MNFTPFTPLCLENWGHLLQGFSNWKDERSKGESTSHSGRQDLKSLEIIPFTCSCSDRAEADGATGFVNPFI